MKKNIFILANLLFCLGASAQEHFGGISTSNRVGILNGDINPAEYSNLTKKNESNVTGISFSFSNDILDFDAIKSGEDIEDILFQGNAPINARLDIEVLGPGYAIKLAKWGFAFTTKTKTKFDIIDIDPQLGKSLINGDDISLGTASNLISTQNQKISGISYSEIGFSASRSIINTEKHNFNIGATFKLLFPSAYSNLGLNNLNGTITKDATSGDLFLSTSSPATLNIAYSENLTKSFTDIQAYTKNIFGSINGFAGDLGATYRLKDGKNKDKHKLKIGVSLRNIGSMTFKNDAENSKNYTLNTASQSGGKYNLDNLSGLNELKEIEDKLIADGVITKIDAQKDFVVKLPTTITSYIDVKVISKFHISGFMQKKVNKDNTNGQIATPNIYSITPRINFNFFETYVPVTVNEISGTNIGFGFRIGGFYLGTNSLVSSLLANGKQGDFYLGSRIQF